MARSNIIFLRKLTNRFPLFRSLFKAYALDFTFQICVQRKRSFVLHHTHLAIALYTARGWWKETKTRARVDKSRVYSLAPKVTLSNFVLNVLNLWLVVGPRLRVQAIWLTQCYSSSSLFSAIPLRFQQSRIIIELSLVGHTSKLENEVEF